MGISIPNHPPLGIPNHSHHHPPNTSHIVPSQLSTIGVGVTNVEDRLSALEVSLPGLKDLTNNWEKEKQRWWDKCLPQEKDQVCGTHGVLELLQHMCQLTELYLHFPNIRSLLHTIVILITEPFVVLMH